MSRLIVLVLLGSFALLLIEIRYLHQSVLGDQKIAWTPIVYSGLMLIIGVAGLIGWHHGGRRVLFWAFALGLLVGPLGFWYHNMGHPLVGLRNELAAWTQPVGPAEGEHGPAAGGEEPAPEGGGHAQGEGHHGEEKPSPDQEPAAGAAHGEGEGHESDQPHGHGGDHVALEGPPALAPLSFFGLGLLGMLACARRLQPPTPAPEAGA
ncbi:MAG: hypothetical protein IRY99_04835 [Isosphaeraceae bacterium]|nr:hypothetical protein [Isosphaeraceae bacterium]